MLPEKAMILAAGRGTRLKPLTDRNPKALAPVNGTPLLELTIRRLMAFGINEFVINVHHFADDIVRFLEQQNNFGAHIEISREEELLNTGGALKHAMHFFPANKPALVHNVDIITLLDYRRLYAQHLQTPGTLATLAVRSRKTNRYLLFDEDGVLAGWESVQPPETKLMRPDAGPLQRLSFMGVHIFSPAIAEHFPDEDEFSIIDVWLKAAADGASITCLRGDEYKWIDTGTVEKIRQAESLVDKNYISNGRSSTR